MSWKLSCRPICTRLHHSGDSCQICQFATHRRIEALFTLYFLALLVQALIERELRLAMKREKIAHPPGCGQSLKGQFVAYRIAEFKCLCNCLGRVDAADHSADFSA